MLQKLLKQKTPLLGLVRLEDDSAADGVTSWEGSHIATLAAPIYVSKKKHETRMHFAGEARVAVENVERNHFGYWEGDVLELPGMSVVSVHFFCSTINVSRRQTFN